MSRTAYSASSSSNEAGTDPARDAPSTRVLAGFGRTAPTAATVVAPDSPDAIGPAVATANGRGAIPRGLGRSYGDAAQRAGGLVVSSTGLDAVGSVTDDGLLTVGAGASIDTILRAHVPGGWFVPVTPGTRQVTVGGAIAADIHGKNHHRDGSVGRHVDSLVLHTGPLRLELAPDRDPDAFWATVGGMGLTGVLSEATLRMLPIETSRMVVDTERTPDLDATMARMVESDGRYRYSVAWLDITAPGRSLGRGVLSSADHASVGDLAVDDRADPLAYRAPTAVDLPEWVTGGLLRPATIRAFNELWYRRAPRRRTGEIQSIPAFFHPLDGVGGWNRLYGRPGFVQHQFVVPDDAADVVRYAVERFASAGTPSFLTVLKRFGPGTPAPLSFPMAGWTLAVDIAADRPGLADVLDDIDEAVVAAGGRVYLAKDSRLRAELVPAMYPRLDEWRSIRDRLDPDRRFVSDQSVRLGIVEP